MSLFKSLVRIFVLLVLIFVSTTLLMELVGMPLFYELLVPHICISGMLAAIIERSYIQHTGKKS
jgi:hypothetical protein